jgi:alpha-mannosidase
MRFGSPTMFTVRVTVTCHGEAHDISVVSGAANQGGVSLVTVDAPGVIVETIKRGEDDFVGEARKTVIIRMYDSFGGRTSGRLKM